jgi:hypothetical protein
MGWENRQPTSVRLDYRAADRQTQPNAIWFGREKRVEHSFGVLGSDPGPGILDTNKDPILEMLGTHTEHVRTIYDSGHGVDSIRKEVK